MQVYLWISTDANYFMLPLVRDNAYIINIGQVEISKGKGKQKVVLSVLREGDIFGEMGLSEDKPPQRNGYCTGRGAHEGYKSREV